MLEPATLIWRHARHRGDAMAVVFGDERLTYAQFGARVARSANLLRSLGIGKGDKVATVLDNSREALELVWAVPAVGPRGGDGDRRGTARLDQRTCGRPVPARLGGHHHEGLLAQRRR